MTTYQVQLRDFRTKRVTRVVASGVGHDEATRAGHAALVPYKRLWDEYHYSLPFNRQIEIRRPNGLHRDEYVRLVAEPEVDPNAPGECNRCYAETPPEDPDSEWENLCVNCEPDGAA